MQNTQYVNVAGTFEGVVERPDAGWFGESGEKQTPYVRVPVRITSDDQCGRLAMWYGYLTEKSVDNTVAKLREAFGFDGDWNALYEGKVTLEGMPCNITTEIETYNGKERCKVAWLNAPGGGGPKPMDDAKVKGLLAKITPKSKAIAKAMPAPAMAAKAQQEPDDDVPF
jgi:hypothetical protein